MARVWVKGYTKSDGTKVDGHYRNTSSSGGSSKARRKEASILTKIGRLESKMNKTKNTSYSQRLYNRITRLNQSLDYLKMPKNK